MQEHGPIPSLPGESVSSQPLDAQAAEATRARDFLGEPFRPRRPFVGGHAQTIAGNFLPRQNQLPPAEERLFRVEPEVQVLCHCHWQADRASAMTLVVVHGLEGSSDSQYVIGTGSKAGSASGVMWTVPRDGRLESSGSITITLGSSSLKVTGRR